MTVVRRSIAPGSFGKEEWQCEITSSGFLSLLATKTASGPLWMAMYRSTVRIPFSCCRIPMSFFRAFRHRRLRYLRAIFSSYSVKTVTGTSPYITIPIFRRVRSGIRRSTCARIEGLASLKTPVGSAADWYARAKLFPIMHTLGVRKTLADNLPWLPGALAKAFEKAKTLALTRLTARAAT